MAFIKRVTDILPGFGIPSNQGLKIEGTSFTSSGVTVTLPASGSLSPTISCGYVRIASTGTVGSVMTLNFVQGTDGTTTVDLYPEGLALNTGTNKFDIIIPFRSNLNMTSVSVKLTAASTATSCDVELAGSQ